MARLYFPQYARGRDGAKLHPGESVLQHIRRLGGVEIDSECGGRGVCGREVIRLECGAESLTPPTEADRRLLKTGQLKPGQRLACQARVCDIGQNIEVYIPNFGKYTILSDHVHVPVRLDLYVVLKNGRVIHFQAGDLGSYEGRILGLAIDHPGGLKELQGSVVEEINQSLAELDKLLGLKTGIRDHIYEVVAVGNSTMRELFFGRDARGLGFIPFEAADKSALTARAAEMGLEIHPKAVVYGPPLIGGHAGSDCLADIVATGLYESADIGMIIDIGTNGEVVIGNRNKLLKASCAPGGAYEGYQIRCGVGAIDGAVTRFKIVDGRTCLQTLGGKHPVGVCGSGVIDLLAELVRHGIMSSSARIQHDYCFADGLCLTQEDINQLIIAKAGLRTDQDLLIRYFGITPEKVTKIYLAGAFGNFMDIDNALAIGLLPRINKDRFVRFRNGALAGARAILCSRRKRTEAEKLRGILTHLKPSEIEGESFQFLVADNMYFY